MTARILKDLWRGVGGDAAALANVELTGTEPALPSSHHVGLAARASIAAVGLAAAEVHRLRDGPAQRVAVSMRDAAVEFLSERYLRIDGKPPPDPGTRSPAPIAAEMAAGSASTRISDTTATEYWRFSAASMSGKPWRVRSGTGGRRNSRTWWRNAA